MIKRGQVTIFVIAGILIVAAVAVVILVINGKVPTIGKPTPSNPEGFLSTCISDNVKQGVNILSEHGGSTNNPLNLNFKFTENSNPISISYLCYSAVNNEECTEKQVLFPYFEKNLKGYINDNVKNCFESLVSNLKKQGYGVNDSYEGFNLKIDQKYIDINISAEITAERSVTQRYNGFNLKIPSDIYGMLQTVQGITNTVATTCNFDNYNLIKYPNYDINWSSTVNSSTIFTVRDRNTNSQFNFATRGCVISIYG